MESRVINHQDLSWEEPTVRADPVILTDPAGAEPWEGREIGTTRDDDVPPPR